MSSAGVQTANVNGLVDKLRFNANGHGVADSVAHLETRGELGRAEQDRAPVVAPRPEAALLEVGGVAILLGESVEAFLVDEAGVQRCIPEGVMVGYSEQKIPIAYGRLGQMYEKGSGVPKDMAKAREWYQKAAENNARGSQRGGGRMQMGRGDSRNFSNQYNFFFINT